MDNTIQHHLAEMQKINLNGGTGDFKTGWEMAIEEIEYRIENSNEGEHYRVIPPDGISHNSVANDEDTPTDPQKQAAYKAAKVVDLLHNYTIKEVYRVLGSPLSDEDKLTKIHYMLSIPKGM